MQKSLAFRVSTHDDLRNHLYPGNKLEAAAIMLCHYGQGKDGFRLMVKELILIPADKCREQTSSYLQWPFADYMSSDTIEKVDKEGLSIFTVHSHPNGFRDFSTTDDVNDKELFHSISGWFDDNRPNGSAVMLPEGEMICRTVDKDGNFSLFQSVSVVGESIEIWKQPKEKQKIPAYGERISQTFGKKTFGVLQRLKIGVIGCSGTGSIIVELLTRNCVGQLVLVDPDIVEEKNLNRIVNTKKSDAQDKLHKVESIKNAIDEIGLGTKVVTYISDTYDTRVIEALCDCDVIFGCVDSVAGRYHLECIAYSYFIPYFDVGVHLEADGSGGISHADMVANYIHPGNNSLIERGVYTSRQLTAENLKRYDRNYYEVQKQAGYLDAVDEDQPAVISINMQAACLAFNDFLARLHNFRVDANADFSIQKFQLVHGCYLNESGGDVNSKVFGRDSGMGEKSLVIKRIKERNEI